VSWVEEFGWDDVVEAEGRYSHLRVGTDEGVGLEFDEAGDEMG